MGKQRTLPKEEGRLQAATLPHCHVMCVGQEIQAMQYRIFRDKVAALEEALSQMGFSSQMPF